MTYDEAVHKLIYESGKGKGPSWVGRELKFNSQAIPQWFKEGSRVPKDRAFELAALYQVDPAALLHGRIEPIVSDVMPMSSATIDVQVIRDLIQQPEDVRLLEIWGDLSRPTRILVLEIIEAVTASLKRRKIG